MRLVHATRLGPVQRLGARRGTLRLLLLVPFTATAAATTSTTTSTSTSLQKLADVHTGCSKVAVQQLVKDNADVAEELLVVLQQVAGQSLGVGRVDRLPPLRGMIDLDS